MPISAAGRDYRTQDVGDERYWTCETCGALVGPQHRALTGAVSPER